jgi:hypothetical protein
MALPLEAELANPPIFTPEQEAHIMHSPTGDLADDPDLHVTVSQRGGTTATDQSVVGATGGEAGTAVGSSGVGERRVMTSFNARGW